MNFIDDPDHQNITSTAKQQHHRLQTTALSLVFSFEIVEILSCEEQLLILELATSFSFWA